MLVFALAFCDARASEPGREDAKRLASEAFAEHLKGDRMESGWPAVYDRGAELANRAIAADPQFPDGYFALFVNLARKAERGSVAQQTFALPKLKELLKKTLELDPRHARAWDAQGELLLRLPRLLGGSQTEGERALRRAAELAPSWARPGVLLAELDWKRGRVEEARAGAERARDLARAADDDESGRLAAALLTKIESGRR